MGPRYFLAGAKPTQSYSQDPQQSRFLGRAMSPKTCDAVAARRGRRRLVTKGTSHLACGLVPKAQAAELVPRFEKRTGNHAVLGSSFFDRRSRRCRFGIWRNRRGIGWHCEDLVLHLSGPAFGLPRHPLHERIPHTLRRTSHAEKILTERL